MNIQRKPGFVAVLLAASLFLLQSCATIVQGTSQKIPVTSAPIGARVLVDGKDMGTTPLTLKLGKKKPRVIRIEKEGYNPHIIRVMRKKPSQFSLAVFGNAAIGAPFGAVLGPKLVNANADDLGEAIGQAIGQWFFYSVLVATAVALPLLLVDHITGAAYSLSPKSLDIVLAPAGGEPRLEITEIGEAQLRDVKWLRIRALDKTAGL
jgi:hypothetical protein